VVPVVSVVRTRQLTFRVQAEANFTPDKIPQTYHPSQLFDCMNDAARRWMKKFALARRVLADSSNYVDV
jgi:hypothetical protein